MWGHIEGAEMPMGPTSSEASSPTSRYPMPAHGLPHLVGRIIPRRSKIPPGTPWAIGTWERLILCTARSFWESALCQ